MDYCAICGRYIADFATHYHSAEHQRKSKEQLKKQQDRRAAAVKTEKR